MTNLSDLEDELDEVYTKNNSFVTSKVTESQIKMRLDKFLAESFPEFSRSQIARMIDSDAVRLVSDPQKVLSSDDKVKLGDVYELTPPDAVAANQIGRASCRERV